MHRKKHDDLEDYDELLRQAVKEHRRKVFFKKLLLAFTLALLVGGIFYQKVTRGNFYAQAVLEQNNNQ